MRDRPLRVLADLAIRSQVHEDMNGCLHSWLRDRIGGIPRRTWDRRRVTVGVHIRWGDAAGQFRGSMSIENINSLLRDIRNKFGTDNLDISLVMEQHDPAILRQIDTPKYRLVDSGDSLADMKRLADNNIMLVAESSYAATAHLLAPPGLTIGQIEQCVLFLRSSPAGPRCACSKAHSRASLQCQVRQHVSIRSRICLSRTIHAGMAGEGRVVGEGRVSILDCLLDRLVYSYIRSLAWMTECSGRAWRERRCANP